MVLYPVMLCAKVGRVDISPVVLEKKNVKRKRRQRRKTTDKRQILIRKAHMSLRLRWAKQQSIKLWITFQIINSGRMFFCFVCLLFLAWVFKDFLLAIITVTICNLTLRTSRCQWEICLPKVSLKLNEICGKISYHREDKFKVSASKICNQLFALFTQS